MNNLETSQGGGTFGLVKILFTKTEKFCYIPDSWSNIFVNVNGEGGIRQMSTPVNKGEGGGQK